MSLHRCSWRWIPAVLIALAPTALAFATQTVVSARDGAAAAVEEHLSKSRDATLRACAERNIQLPPDLLKWVDADRDARRAIYGSWSDPIRSLLA
ncbi:MAG: hypothetical protein ACKO4V_03835, partial [Planctomycetota bacterium]